MAKKQEKQSASMEKRIVEEICQKSDDFDENMSSYMSSVGEWGDLFRVIPPRRQDRTFSNPRQTEFYRAATSVATLVYRMMTSADPFFEIRPAELRANYGAIDTLRHTWDAQLRAARYREHLLRACHYAPVYGTVICQEDYRVIGASPFGRRIPTTVMIPRPMDQVGFDRATIDIQEADWIYTADVTSKAELMRLAQEAKDLGAPWNPKALEAAANSTETANTINTYVKERIRRLGYAMDDVLNRRKELIFFNGKLDCLNDSLEYVAAVVNRKYLVRFHANNFQHGRRNFRVAKWCDFYGALGEGLGSLLGHTHKSMDSNRQKAQDLFSFGAYQPMERQRSAQIADEDMVIRPLQIIDSDTPQGIRPVPINIGAADGILRLDEFLKQEFRAASNASDTLQAIASDTTTATQSALSQDQNIRALSVKAEQMSESLVREHLEVNHANNLQNIRAPFNINKAGAAHRVYPMDLRLDVDIYAKTTTDKDFSPKRLEKLLNLLQMLTSTKSDHPDQLDISIKPIVTEIAYMLEVDPSEVVMNPRRPPMGAQLGSADMIGMSQLSDPNIAGGGVVPVSTPVGGVMTA